MQDKNVQIVGQIVSAGGAFAVCIAEESATTVNIVFLYGSFIPHSVQKTVVGLEQVVDADDIRAANRILRTHNLPLLPLP